MERNKLNEALKAKEQQERLNDSTVEVDGHLRLDDTQRVKVLSPSALVAKRFIRNKLAIVGSCILIFMFVFSFLCPLFYPYRQTQVFYKYDYLTTDYANATRRTEYINFVLDDSAAIDSYVSRMMNSNISTLESGKSDSLVVAGRDDGKIYVIDRLGEGVYTLGAADGEAVAHFSASAEIGTYKAIDKSISYKGAALGSDFEAAAANAIGSGKTQFSFDGVTYTASKLNKMEYSISSSDSAVIYSGKKPGGDFEEKFIAAAEGSSAEFEAGGVQYAVSSDNGSFIATKLDNTSTVLVSTTMAFNSYGPVLSDELKAEALLNSYSKKTFECDGEKYKVVNDDGELILCKASDNSPVALMSSFIVRDSKGNDNFDIDFKRAVEEFINDMEDKGVKESSFVYPIASKMTDVDENGNEYMTARLDESGKQIYEDTEIKVALKTGSYVMTCPQLRHLIDISAGPSKDHIFGTDTDGMDILARMMYGGRVSLMVGFVVVIIETLLGVIMGGIAGYFGGWVDNLIMRLVDVFYCIPSMPILIIMGAFMDAQKMTPYVRLIYMMAVLGILGWAGVARLVRGQILSLREQEFMVATEATGVRVKHRIFRHLVPNVMPQLIVTATAGLGSVILTESTLSFLGLGVKHPLATWGTMINSVTQSNENIIKYTYIWIPVGLLICLTVVAFNFVGDGLRDAFDPKMKR